MNASQSSGQLLLDGGGGALVSDAQNDVASSKFLTNLVNPNLTLVDGQRITGTGTDTKCHIIKVKQVFPTPTGADSAMIADNSIMASRASGFPEALVQFRDSTKVDTGIFPQPDKGCIIQSNTIRPNFQLKMFDGMNIIASSITAKNIGAPIARRGTITAASLEGYFPAVHSSNVSEQTIGRFITDEANKQTGISQDNQVTMVQHNPAAFDDISRETGYHHGSVPAYVSQKIINGQDLVIENDDHNAVRVVGWGTPGVANPECQKEFQIAEPLLQADIFQETVDTGLWIGTNRMHVRPIYGVTEPDPIVIASSKIPYIHSPSGTGVVPLFRKDANMVTVSVNVHMEGAPLFSDATTGTGMFSNASAVRHVARNAYAAAAVEEGKKSIFYNRKQDLAIPQYFGQGATKGKNGVKSTGWLFSLELLGGTKTTGIGGTEKIEDVVIGVSQVYACMGMSTDVTQTQFSKVVSLNQNPITSWQNIGAAATTTETFDIGQSITINSFGGLCFDNWFVYAGMNSDQSTSSTVTGWRITAQPYTDAPFRNAGAVPRPLDCWAKGGEVSKIAGFDPALDATIIPGYIDATNNATWGPNGYYIITDPQVSLFDLTSGPTFINPLGMPIIAYGGTQPLVGHPTEGQLINDPANPLDDTTASLDNNPALIEASLTGMFRLGGFGACRFGKQNQAVGVSVIFQQDDFFGPGGFPMFLRTAVQGGGFSTPVTHLRVGTNAIDYFAEFKIKLNTAQPGIAGQPIPATPAGFADVAAIQEITLVTDTTSLYGPSGTLDGFPNGWNAWFVNANAATNPNASVRPDFGWGSQGALYNRMQSFAISYIPVSYDIRDGGFGYKVGTGVEVNWRPPNVQSAWSMSPGAPPFVGIPPGQGGGAPITENMYVIQSKAQIDYTTDVNGDANNFVLATHIKDSKLQKINNDNVTTHQNVILFNGLQPEGTTTLAGNSIIEVEYSIMVTGELKSDMAHIRSPPTTAAGSLDVKTMLALRAMAPVLPRIFVSENQLAVSDAVFASVGMTGKSAMNASGINFFRGLAKDMTRFARTLYRGVSDMAKGLSPEARDAIAMAIQTKEAKNVIHRMESMVGLSEDSIVPMGRQVYDKMIKSSSDGRLRADWIDDAYRGGNYIVDLVERVLPLFSATDGQLAVVKSNYRTWASVEEKEKCCDDPLFASTEHGKATFPVVDDDGNFIKGINLHVDVEPPMGKKFTVRKTYQGGARVSYASNFVNSAGQPAISNGVHKAIEAWSRENPGEHKFWIYPDVDQKIYGRSFEMAVLSALKKKDVNITGAIEDVIQTGDMFVAKPGAVTNVGNKSKGLSNLIVPDDNEADIRSSNARAIEGMKV